MELWAERDVDLVIAGPVDGGGEFRLHLFDAAGGSKTVPIPAGFHAEAVISYPGDVSRVLLLSDDGSAERSGRKAKELPPGHPDRYFRSHWLPIG